MASDRPILPLSVAVYAGITKWNENLGRGDFRFLPTTAIRIIEISAWHQAALWVWIQLVDATHYYL